MSTLRPECKASDKPALPKETILFLVKQAVGHRRKLIHGKLHDNFGGHCAMGCFFQDHPHNSVPADLIEEIAAVNDSLPNGTPQARWKMVRSWLRMKLAVLAKRAK